MEGLITKSVAKHFVWVGLLMFFISSCSPARYTHLRKEKAERKEIHLVSGPETQSEATALAEQVTEESTEGKYAEPDIIAPAEEPELYASASGSEYVSDKKLARAVKKMKKLEKRLEMSVSPVVKAIKSKESRAEVEARQGLLWSLVAAVLVVWLVGVLFTNAGGLVHVLLGIALILIVMNLLA
jgi:Flp pilus assembly protein TadB